MPMATKQSNTNQPRQSSFKEKKSCLGFTLGFSSAGWAASHAQIRTSTCSTGERDFDRIWKRQETCLLQLHYEERVSWFQNILYIVLHLGTWN